MKKVLQLALLLSLVASCRVQSRSDPATQRHNIYDDAIMASSGLRTYKVVLTNSKRATNKTVFVQARSTSEARDNARDQYPGWQVLLVSEVK